VIYFLEDGKVRGMMMCNVWGKVDDAREIIKRNEKIPTSRLAGAVK
jgi:3-phenylpropionate/trans-cinnamate dioxygenase ferredoxin reductase component